MSEIELKATTWSEDAETIKSIRVPVFVEEQHVPFEEDFDGSDEPCQQVLAYVEGKAVGTGRTDAEGHIGRIAVLKEYRGLGIGAEIVLFLVELGRQQGLQGVYLHAQCAAEGFYRNLGFYPVGDIFLDANIDHVRMNLDFD